MPYNNFILYQKKLFEDKKHFVEQPKQAVSLNKKLKIDKVLSPATSSKPVTISDVK